MPLRVSLHGEIRFLPRQARAPPNFTAPAPCVRSPSGRSPGCAHPALPSGRHEVFRSENQGRLRHWRNRRRDRGCWRHEKGKVLPFWGAWLLDFKAKYFQPTQQSYLLRLLGFPLAEADIRAARGEMGLRAQFDRCCNVHGCLVKNFARMVFIERLHGWILGSPGFFHWRVLSH